MSRLSELWTTSKKWVVLFLLTVLLPAFLLALFTIRTFKAEEARLDYQRRERQQQILRLLDAELNTWLLSLDSASAVQGVERIRFEGDQAVLVGCNVSFGAPARVARPLSALEARDWQGAQAAELGGQAASSEIRARYVALAKRLNRVAPLARLALLRLALAARDTEGAGVWLRSLHRDDPDATTESGIPIRIAAALLLVGQRKVCESGGEFLRDTLRAIEQGRWRLRSEQWILYASEIGGALEKGSPQEKPPAARERLVRRLRTLSEIHPQILALKKGLVGSRFPVYSRFVPELGAFLALFPAATADSGFLVEETQLRRRASERLAALLAAEDFKAVVAGAAGPSEFRLASFPELPIAFTAREGGSALSSFRKYSFYYSTIALLAVAMLGLIYTYRAVAHELAVARLKADFVAAVSHEFRSPLTSILALLERLESGRVKDAATLERYHAVMRQEVRRLGAVVAGLLDFARLDKGKQEFRLEAADLAELAADAVRSFQNLGQGDRLDLVRAGGAPTLAVSVDRTAIAQCVQNLIENALKYSPKESRVVVRCGRQNGSCYVEVIDRGPGIPASEQKRIFEQFYRARSTDALNVKGVGLGLALVKRIVEGHGGRVTVESEPGKGSTFRLILPPPGEISAQ